MRYLEENVFSNCKINSWGKKWKLLGSSEMQNAVTEVVD